MSAPAPARVPCKFVGCPKSYKTSDQAREHHQVAHQGKRYRCSVCGHGGFKSRGMCSTHIKKKHPGGGKAKAVWPEIQDLPVIFEEDDGGELEDDDGEFVEPPTKRQKISASETPQATTVASTSAAQENVAVVSSIPETTPAPSPASTSAVLGYVVGVSSTPETTSAPPQLNIAAPSTSGIQPIQLFDHMRVDRMLLFFIIILGID